MFQTLVRNRQNILFSFGIGSAEMTKSNSTRKGTEFRSDAAMKYVEGMLKVKLAGN